MVKKAVIGKAEDIQPVIMNNDKVKNVEKRVLIGKKIGAGNFVMRLFKVGPDGHSPRHSHVWEHEIYIIKGTAGIFDGEKEVAAPEGSYVFVPGGVEHQIKNIGTGEMHFLCLIPSTADEE
ncbi:MAG TPA: cupin domain-containing protein [Petrotogaceae bacterium]|jgi:quercetin dioxygenase-like cupin family protein|nr:cupin domain-containing protein [Petrotogaceae bacterium]HNY37418.1 cupin domain-containing protein [Petrotogaceae bacterium]HOG34912.1 cupin domain-containing protein [Petrotogaceae bacterium]HPX16857.1 cupin domain-containing protein [Petrotogaceae bacterium]HQC41043.1 cupin domain-containing protein [Petrotogaceae bacterium]